VWLRHHIVLDHLVDQLYEIMFDTSDTRDQNAFTPRSQGIRVVHRIVCHWEVALIQSKQIKKKRTSLKRI
jgi:hypothetical protein